MFFFSRVVSPYVCTFTHHSCICNFFFSHTHFIFPHVHKSCPKFLSDAFQARTRETHANHCADLGGPLHNHYATTYGLHRDSSLNTLQYFHVTEGLIPDIMHDCLEGCVQYEVKELLKSLSSRRLLSVSAINNLIQSFPYLGPDARNRPSLISDVTLASPDHTLKQTGQ